MKEILKGQHNLHLCHEWRHLQEKALLTWCNASKPIFSKCVGAKFSYERLVSIQSCSLQPNVPLVLFRCLQQWEEGGHQVPEDRHNVSGSILGWGQHDEEPAARAPRPPLRRCYPGANLHCHRVHGKWWVETISFHCHHHTLLALNDEEILLVPRNESPYECTSTSRSDINVS